MSKTRERVIKITKDGRFHAFGLVVNTFDEAVERCTQKGHGNYFLEWPSKTVLGMEAIGGVCGSPEYLRKFIK